MKTMNPKRSIYDWKAHQKRMRMRKIVKNAVTRMANQKSDDPTAHAEFYRWRLMNERDQTRREQRFILMFKIIPSILWIGIPFYFHSMTALFISGVAFSIFCIDYFDAAATLNKGPFDHFFYIIDQNEDVEHLVSICKTNCKGLWDIRKVGNLPMFSFEFETDAAMFRMFRQ